MLEFKLWLTTIIIMLVVVVYFSFSVNQNNRNNQEIYDKGYAKGNIECIR